MIVGEEMSESLRAVYRDQQGHTYSCPVVDDGGAWKMVTSDGPQPITHEFQDDVAGKLVFVEYRKTEDTRLHVEPGSGFRGIQEASAKAEMEYRASRQRARQQALNALNEPNVRKIQEARRINNEYAEQMRPRGGGQFIAKGE
jgi:hypothetical protein